MFGRLKNGPPLYGIVLFTAAAGALLALSLIPSGPATTGARPPAKALPAARLEAPPPPAPAVPTVSARPHLSEAKEAEAARPVAKVAAKTRGAKMRFFPAQPSVASVAERPAAVQQHPDPRQVAECTAKNALPLKSLGMPLPAARGEGIDVASLKAACQKDSSADLSDRLGLKKGENLAGPSIKAPEQRIRATLGGYQGRPISEKQFTVNVGSTFR